MLSTELPITEWWDPEWDVYDVPLSPFTGAGAELEVPYDVWWAAWSHIWTLDWITTGTAWYAPHNWQNQLEPARRPPSWYPGQPEPPRHRFRACTCSYGLRQVTNAPGPYTPVPPPSGEGALSWWTRCFVIVFDCPHHGDDRLEEELLLDDLYGDGGVWGIEFDETTQADRVLDEDERTGH